MSQKKHSKHNLTILGAYFDNRKIELLGGLMNESDKKVVEGYLEVRTKTVKIKKIN